FLIQVWPSICSAFCPGTALAWNALVHPRCMRLLCFEHLLRFSLLAQIKKAASGFCKNVLVILSLLVPKLVSQPCQCLNASGQHEVRCHCNWGRAGRKQRSNIACPQWTSGARSRKGTFSPFSYR